MREKEVRVVEICPWREAGAVEGEAAKVSMSVRRREDCLSAELKSAFCGGSAGVGVQEGGHGAPDHSGGCRGKARSRERGVLGSVES